MSAKENMYEYAIEATGDTNETIAEYLSRIGIGNTADATFTDNKGRGHSGWLVSYDIVTLVGKNKEKFNLKYRVFFRKNSEDIFRELPHKAKGKLSRQKKVKEAKKTAEEIKRRKAV